MTELVKLGNVLLFYHPGSRVLLYTHNVDTLLYSQLKCSLTDDKITDCPRPVVGVIDKVAFCEHHKGSPSFGRINYTNDNMHKVYRHLRCSIPHAGSSCIHVVMGVYKDRAFCRIHLLQAVMEMR